MQRYTFGPAALTGGRPLLAAAALLAAVLAAPTAASSTPQPAASGRSPARAETVSDAGVRPHRTLGAHRTFPTSEANSQSADDAARIGRLLSALAHDSLAGRRTGTPGALAAGRIIAEELRRSGVEPAGDDGYFQAVPLVRSLSGPRRLTLAGDDAGGAGDGERLEGRNVVGVIRGTHPDRGREVVVVGAHYDHLGVGAPLGFDSIYNGADDDASGVVAVLEAARALAVASPPERTVVFLLSTGEEQGLLGTRWYLRDPVEPVERTVANLQVEMIGRPDALAGGPGRVWLTGYERSTMGELLRSGGVPVMADPRPAQQFFLRSDNIAFARAGVPAHTLSSYGMHEDYHTPDDEVERVNLDHLASAVDAVVRSVRVLAGGEAPRWLPGGRPSGGDR